jgi:hypothetical protein
MVTHKVVPNDEWLTVSRPNRRPRAFSWVLSSSSRRKVECNRFATRVSALVLRGSEPQPTVVPPVFAQPFFQ